jgi:MFS family permease
MDRMNISLAMAGGIDRDLHLSMTRSGLAAGVFFIGYMLLQVPAGHIAEHLSAKKYVLWSILAMGTVSILTGFVQNGAQLIGMRFLLGVAEGGIYPALLIVVSNWFPSKEIGRANAVFLASLPLSTVLTNPISGWLVSRYDWRWMFFVEGGFACCLVLLVIPMISDRPREAKRISEEERTTEETLKSERLASERRFQSLPAPIGLTSVYCGQKPLADDSTLETNANELRKGRLVVLSTVSGRVGGIVRFRRLVRQTPQPSSLDVSIVGRFCI